MLGLTGTVAVRPLPFSFSLLLLRLLLLLTSLVSQEVKTMSEAWKRQMHVDAAKVEE